MTIGERIRKCRMENKMTQKELGENLGITQQMIGQYESGTRNPKIEQLRKIADALGVSFFQLTDGDYSWLPPEELQKDFLQAATPLKDFHKMIVEKALEEENALLTDFSSLNDVGRTEARKRVAELTEIKRYTEIEEPFNKD